MHVLVCLFPDGGTFQGAHRHSAKVNNPFHYYISYFSAKPTLFESAEEKEKRNRKKPDEQRPLLFLLIKHLPSGQRNLEAGLLLSTLISLSHWYKNTSMSS